MVGKRDAARANRLDASSTIGIFIGLASADIRDGTLSRVSLIVWRSSNIDQKCRSAVWAETRACVDTEDEFCACRLQWAELSGHDINVRDIDATAMKVSGLLTIDSRNVYDKLHKTMLTLVGAEKWSDLEALI